MKVTNNSQALQGVQTSTGTVFIRPGDSKDVALTKAQAERAGRLRFLALKGSPIEDPAPSSERVGADAKGRVYLKVEEFNAMREQFEVRDADIDRLQKENDDLRKQISAKAQTPEQRLKAEHHGGGKFNVTEGETVHLSGLSKADADAFNAMSDEDKAKFVEGRKAAS